ncbi:hypothetical protein [Sulfitobacter sp. R18_1]|uniref:hypothetical protein n=1 Tax=Sulfitobacter sp. R18_1 TaxID=2821104 RepID=UPI001AD95E86|nr:hypothetical protein [Sulfitobacter sp. R18_1]
MLRTVIVSNYIHVQGTFVRALEDGDIMVCTGNRKFLGKPINPIGPSEVCPTPHTCETNTAA